VDGVDVAALVQRAAHGDERAWADLVEQYASLVWAVARGHGLGQADAADVSQTTWLRLAERLDLIREPHRLGAWLATTARRESLRTLRRQERYVSIDQYPECEAEDGTPKLIDDLVARERDEALWDAFEALPCNCRVLLRAMLADPSPSYAELSTMLEMPIGSIGPTRARCLDRLREQFESRQVHTQGRRSAASRAKRRVS